jgi:hypothetical protein
MKQAIYLGMSAIQPAKTSPRYANVCAPDVPFYGEIGLGNGTQFVVGAMFVAGGFFVGIYHAGSFRFMGNGDLLHWRYVGEKLDIAESDARAMADWISAQTGRAGPEQGEYEEEFCGPLDWDAIIAPAKG